jgi:hypothetical protein
MSIARKIDRLIAAVLNIIIVAFICGSIEMWKSWLSKPLIPPPMPALATAPLVHLAATTTPVSNAYIVVRHVGNYTLINEFRPADPNSDVDWTLIPEGDDNHPTRNRRLKLLSYCFQGSSISAIDADMIYLGFTQRHSAPDIA